MKTAHPTEAMEPIDLTPFCSHDPSRPTLCAPHVLPDGRAFATDARILILGPPASFAPFEPSVFAAPPVSAIEIPRDSWGLECELPAGWRELPEVPIPCPECEGTGRNTECPACEGSGKEECLHCGSETDCESCKGSGRRPGEGTACGVCGGTCHVSARVPVWVRAGDKWACVDRRFLHLLDGTGQRWRLWLVTPGRMLGISFERSAAIGYLMTLAPTTYREEIAKQWPAAVTA